MAEGTKDAEPTEVMTHEEFMTRKQRNEPIPSTAVVPIQDHMALTVRWQASESKRLALETEIAALRAAPPSPDAAPPAGGERDRSVPCPTCGFHVKNLVHRPITLEEDAPPRVRDGGEVERAALTPAQVEAACRVVARREACIRYAGNLDQTIAETDRTWRRFEGEVREVLDAALATTAPATGQGDEAVYAPFGYQVLFDAIAAACSPRGKVTVGISVKAFWEALPASCRVALATHPAPKIESPRDLAAVRAEEREACAMLIEARARQCEAANSHRGRINQHGRFGAWLLDNAAVAIRARATLDAAPAPDPASAGPEITEAQVQVFHRELMNVESVDDTWADRIRRAFRAASAGDRSGQDVEVLRVARAAIERGLAALEVFAHSPHPGGIEGATEFNVTLGDMRAFLRSTGQDKPEGGRP